MKDLDKKSNHLNGPALFFGACWYPDHWPREAWETDLRLIKEAGYACVRLGESSWNRFEPQEREFDWGFLDAVLECLEKHDLGLILGTPTCAVAAWLKERYLGRLRDSSERDIIPGFKPFGMSVKNKKETKL